LFWEGDRFSGGNQPQIRPSEDVAWLTKALGLALCSAMILKNKTLAGHHGSCHNSSY
jgi:hypothetical protein